jgi:hypothetical protein
MNMIQPLLLRYKLTVPLILALVSRTSCSVTTFPSICPSTSLPNSRMRPSFCPISETNTPLMENGYEPTRTPSPFTRFCSSVRYGAIEDSGRLKCERGVVS